MSYLRDINEFLEETRLLTAVELNAQIKKLDWNAIPIEDQSIAHATLGYMQSAVLKDQQANFEHAHARALELKAKHGWLFTGANKGQVEAESVAVAKKPPKGTVKVERQTKQQQAQEIYDALEDKTKAAAIKVLAEKLNVTEAGAQTYFYACGGVADAPKTEISKRQQAQEIYDQSPDKSKEVIARLFVEQLGMTLSGARTYYYTCGGTKRNG